MPDRGYTMVVRELAEEEGGGFLAYAPDLHGCMADGETAEAAIADLRNAIEEWIEEAERLGRRVPAPGEAAEQARRERANIKDLLEAQQKLLKTQDELITGQRQEMARIKKSIAGLIGHEYQTARALVTWAGVVDVPVHVAGIGTRRKTSLLTN